MPEFVTQLIAFIVAAAIIAFIVAICVTILGTAIVSAFQVVAAFGRMLGGLVAPASGGRHAAESGARHKAADISKFNTDGWEPQEVEKGTGEVKTWVYRGSPK